MSYPWIAYAVKLLDVWHVRMSPAQQSIFKRVCVCALPLCYVFRRGVGCCVYACVCYIFIYKFEYKLERHVVWSYSLFEQELHQTELFLRWNVSFFLHLNFMIKVTGSRGIKFSLLLPQLCLLKTSECTHWFPVVQMSLEQHAGTLQSPVILSTHWTEFQPLHNAPLPSFPLPPPLLA